MRLYYLDLGESDKLATNSDEYSPLTCTGEAPNLLTMHQLTCDGSMDLGAILQFNSNCLMAEFHQKSE